MIFFYQLNKPEEWKKIIKSFKNYDAYHLPEYVQAFERHGDGEAMLIYYESLNLRAFNVVFKRDIALDANFLGKLPPETYYDLATPYGYGGFIVEGETTKENIELMDQEYISLCRSQGCISEFVRFHPILENDAELTKMYKVQKLGKTVTIKLRSEEQIWNDFESRNRNLIRKAKKVGVEVYWGRNPTLIEEFIKLYNATMDKDHADPYYYFNKEFFESILSDLKYNAQLFYAMYEGKIIAMTIVLASNNQLHYHLSASDINYQKLAPSNLMLFEAACWGMENGYRTLHLGGGMGSSEDNLYRFKKAFNKYSTSNFSIGWKIFNEKIYNDLMAIRKEEVGFYPNESYFPSYRAKKLQEEKMIELSGI